MRALHFAGDEYRLLALAQCIDRTAFDHKIVCVKRETAELIARYGSLRPQFVEAGAQLLDLDLPEISQRVKSNRLKWTASGARTLVQAVARICRLVRALKIDVIDAHVALASPVGVAVGLLTHTPTLVTTYHAEKHFKPLPVWYATHQSTLALASGIMTDAESVREKLQQWMLKKNSRIFVIPNGTAAPLPSEAADNIRRKYNLPLGPGTIVVGAIGRLIPSKGHLVFLHAARRLLQVHPHLFFLIVGYVRDDGGYKARLEQEAVALGIADKVQIIGHPGPIGDMWQVIDIHVHPSVQDVLPNTIMEGMSLSKPQVVTAVGGVPSMVLNGSSGYVVRANDPEAIAASTSKLIESEDLAQRFGSAARARYEQLYTPEAMTRAIERVFADLAR